MRVVLSSLFYPMSISRYFEAALRRRDDVELCTVGPYSGQWIPWNGGTQLPAKYAVTPDIALPSPQNTAVTPVPIEFIEAQLPWKPDLWLQVDAGFYLRGKPKHGKNVIVGTDPHVLNYNAQRQVADTFYCMQAYYADPQDEYLPYAYDPIWHQPEDQSRNYDVCLIGLHYEPRTQLVNELRAHGINVYYDLGPSFDEARALYNQAPIGLNWSSLNDLTARVFELLGMRRLAIVNSVPDLERFFEPGRDLITFDNHDQAVKAVLHYVANPDEADEIATNGYETVGPHSWDARVEQILEAV